MNKVKNRDSHSKEENKKKVEKYIPKLRINLLEIINNSFWIILKKTQCNFKSLKILKKNWGNFLQTDSTEKWKKEWINVKLLSNLILFQVAFRLMSLNWYFNICHQNNSSKSLQVGQQRLANQRRSWGEFL